MLGDTSIRAVEESERVAGTYDLVVVGAGVAGLNALYAAIEYLPRGAKVLLIDQKQAAGGMWNTAYDYVRLHQPHPMFTVGDMKWNWKKPRDYLAKRDEVREHLASAIGRVSQTVDLEISFGWSAMTFDEVHTDCGYRARVTYCPNGSPEQLRSVEALRAIYASGLNYRVAEPLTLSSGNVISIIPQDLRKTLAANPDAPVYVIGGGKTGMDTILATLTEAPGRKVSLINGRGTNFLNRTRYIPTGFKRWISGELVSRLFRDLAYNFDGDNEDHTIAHFRRHHSTDPNSPNGVFLYGLQSEDEHIRIAEGLNRIYTDYLVDVTDDSPDEPSMKLRGGTIEPVERGSVFVNCTGSFFRASDMAERLPCVSPYGTIVSITPRDGFHFLTSAAGFFVTHLLYREELIGKGFYTLDHEALFRQNRNAWVGASAAQAYMNQVIALQTLPMALLDRCGLDLDRWYPLPRRLVGLIRMKSSANRDIAHCRASLDRIADRFGVHCAPLT